MMEMTRRGIAVTSGFNYRPDYTVEHCLTRRALSNDIRLASRIVAKQVVGIRSSVEIPEDFLPWFRYRDGWCILSIRHKIPSGLVRFLLAQWKKRPINLWLLDHCSLKKFLRKHTAVDFVKIDAAGTISSKMLLVGCPGLSRPSDDSRALKIVRSIVGGHWHRGLETPWTGVYPRWINDTAGYA
jgi:hypothetical protein